MDMKITKLREYLKQQWFHHTKHNHMSSEIKARIYESRTERSTTMSKRKFSSYLEIFWISRSSCKSIISKWDEMHKQLLNYRESNAWSDSKKENYSTRYHHTTTSKTLLSELSNEQKQYIITLRNRHPNMWYKRFYTHFLTPKHLKEYEKIFRTTTILSKNLYYEILAEGNIQKRICKRKKRSMIQQLRDTWQLEQYCEKMHHVYSSIKALHRWQLDIKYIIDIPNMVKSWLAFLYPYQITFRDFKSGAVIKFFWHWRDSARVHIATQVIGCLLQHVWIDLKKVILQVDWWWEFSTLKINGAEWQYLEYLKATFGWYRIIQRKEQNWHVEAYHRICEEDFMDTRASVDDMKWLDKNEKKQLFLIRADEYTKRHNMYWFSSYTPRYKVFWKKSPLQIIIDDRWGKINHSIIENYFGAYDVDCGIRLIQKNSYKTLINDIINTNIRHSSSPISNSYSTGQLSEGLYRNIYYFLLQKKRKVINSTLLFNFKTKMEIVSFVLFILIIIIITLYYQSNTWSKNQEIHSMEEEAAKQKEEIKKFKELFFQSIEEVIRLQQIIESQKAEIKKSIFNITNLIETKYEDIDDIMDINSTLEDIIDKDAYRNINGDTIDSELTFKMDIIFCSLKEIYNNKFYKIEYWNEYNEVLDYIKKQQITNENKFKIFENNIHIK